MKVSIFLRQEESGGGPNQDTDYQHMSPLLPGPILYDPIEDQTENCHSHEAEDSNRVFIYIC